MSTWAWLINQLGALPDIVDSASTFRLVDGGLAGMIWTYIVTVVGFVAVVASMVDMASMWGTNIRRLISLGELSKIPELNCLLSASGWQSGTASSLYLAGTMIQGILVFSYPEYTPTRWQGTLFTIAIVLIAAFFNTYGASQLPTLEDIILVLHIFDFFAILIPLWVLSPRTSATEVFTSFSNGGGWLSTGTAVIIGQVVPIFAFVGRNLDA
ncbi:MAG: hypothetical protein M1812_007503 [Candelaria pacifica]|nr:MAG: hypothetical protein M1812_007503 [Candelaria pacifica]